MREDRTKPTIRGGLERIRSLLYRPRVVDQDIELKKTVLKELDKDASELI